MIIATFLAAIAIAFVASQAIRMARHLLTIRPAEQRRLEAP